MSSPPRRRLEHCDFHVIDGGEPIIAMQSAFAPV
jgi:hypothetical protein